MPIVSTVEGNKFHALRRFRRRKLSRVREKTWLNGSVLNLKRLAKLVTVPHVRMATNKQSVTGDFFRKQQVQTRAARAAAPRLQFVSSLLEEVYTPPRGPFRF